VSGAFFHEYAYFVFAYAHAEHFNVFAFD